ncbi:MAG: hypothetical protein EB120_14570 [Proteobacteria bacterium]|nr:hypothetical protein [Pseudomonadota bacterium]
MASLLAKKKPLPEAPSLAQTVETDHCPTCGQTVGMKHKERVRKKNEEILSAYHDELAKVSAYNASVQEEIHQAQLEHDRKKADYLRTVEENNRTVAVKQRLELQLASLKDVEVPQIADIPNPPEENFDEAKYKEVKLAVDKLKSARAQYDYVQKRIAESKVNIEGLQQQIESNLQLISRLEKIEGGLRLLPSEELKLQSSVFEMEDIKVYIDDEIHVLVGGLPYGLLSTGQQMKVALQISSKINEVSRRPLNMFFVDNADLVDELRKTNGQVFLAEVDSSDLTIRGEV